MMGWYRGRRDVVRIAVSAVDIDGRERQWCEDLQAGPDKAWTIPLPDGIRAITVVRPVRVRVDLRRHR